MIDHHQSPHESAARAATFPADPKWSALLEDALFPMPRRRLLARQIKEQAGAHGVLVRDFGTPADIVLADDDMVDLADGNVFRIIDPCHRGADSSSSSPGKSKRAWVIDDSWEVTLQGEQTRESLLGLFGLPADTRLLRDLESPDDQPVTKGERLCFQDGPVFRADVKSIVVIVNVKHHVRFDVRRVNGRKIKETAIAQGVPIDKHCLLFRVKPGGGLSPVIDDDDVIVLRCDDEFRCVAPDDNS